MHSPISSVAARWSTRSRFPPTFQLLKIDLSIIKNNERLVWVLSDYCSAESGLSVSINYADFLCVYTPGSTPVSNAYDPIRTVTYYLSIIQNFRGNASSIIRSPVNFLLPEIELQSRMRSDIRCN